MIFSENRFPLFGIMRSARTLTPGDAGQAFPEQAHLRIKDAGG
jgi:hypothetical protein